MPNPGVKRISGTLLAVWLPLQLESQRNFSETMTLTMKVVGGSWAEWRRGKTISEREKSVCQGLRWEEVVHVSKDQMMSLTGRRKGLCRVL